MHFWGPGYWCQSACVLWIERIKSDDVFFLCIFLYYQRKGIFSWHFIFNSFRYTTGKLKRKKFNNFPYSTYIIYFKKEKWPMENVWLCFWWYREVSNISFYLKKSYLRIKKTNCFKRENILTNIFKFRELLKLCFSCKYNLIIRYCLLSLFVNMVERIHSKISIDVPYGC